MKLKYILVPLIIMSFAFACSNSPQKIIFNLELHKEYQYVIPDSLYSFFPSNKNNEMELIGLSQNAHNLSAIDSFFGEIVFVGKVYECKDDSYITTLEAKCEEEALVKILPSDNDYFIIAPQWWMKYKYGKKILDSIYNQIDFLHLLPDFHQIFEFTSINYDTTTLCGLKSEYENYVLKSGSEFILDEKLRLDRDIFPMKLKHGYKSGIAIEHKGKHVIYWVIAW